MNAYTLDDFNQLAYEFAIRNPKVIELLSQELTDDIVKELLTFGINATSVYIDNETGKESKINSLQELYLDYPHLQHIQHNPYCPYGSGIDTSNDCLGDVENTFRGYRNLVHPDSSNKWYKQESEIDALRRISTLIETRGRGSKLTRLMNGTAFEHFDKVKLEGKTIYSLDPSKNTTKTINTDIKFISEWLQPDYYLQLLPKYFNILGGK